MAVHSGKFAVVNGVDTVRNWSVSETNAPARAIASNTKFGPARRRGVLAWTGSYNKYGGQPLHMPGDVFTFQGYTAPDNDVAGTAGVIYSGSAMVDSVAITWDWTTGGIINHVVNFSGHMALTRSSGTLSDATTPDLPDTPTSLGIKWISGLGDIAIPNSLANIATFVLTLSGANQAYVNSSTVSGGKLWTGRKAGPIDWTAACTVQDNVRGTSGLPEVGDDIKLRAYINATEFWELWWGHVRDYSGLTADRETGAIIQATMNLDMNGIFTDGTEGKIVEPDLTEWWPPAASLILPESLAAERQAVKLSEQEERILATAPEGTFVRPDAHIIGTEELNRIDHENAVNALLAQIDATEDSATKESLQGQLEVLKRSAIGHDQDTAGQPGWTNRPAVTREPATGPALRQRRAPPASQAPASPSPPGDAGGPTPDGNRPKVE